MTILKGIFLKGSPLRFLLIETMLLSVFGLIVFVASKQKIQKEDCLRMLERIKQMVIKEFIQVFRDRRMKAIVFVIPIMQLMVFGYAVTTDVNHITTAFYDLDKSYESRELARRLESSGYFNIAYFPESPKEIQDAGGQGQSALRNPDKQRFFF